MKLLNQLKKVFVFFAYCLLCSFRDYRYYGDETTSKVQAYLTIAFVLVVLSIAILYFLFDKRNEILGAILGIIFYTLKYAAFIVLFTFEYGLKFGIGIFCLNGLPKYGYLPQWVGALLFIAILILAVKYSIVIHFWKKFQE